MASQKNVFSCLRHRSVSCSYNQNCAIHLSCAGDHIFDIIGVARTVNVCIVTFFCFIFNVGCCNCYPACFFFGCVINLVESTNFVCTTVSLCQCCSNSSSECRLAVINVADCTNVDVWFRTIKFLFSHSYLAPINFLKNCLFLLFSIIFFYFCRFVMRKIHRENCPALTYRS